jgi:hypothetical protein
MTRAVLFAIMFAAACEQNRTVTLLLGPDDKTLTAGFTCKDTSGNLLLDSTRSGDAFVFQIVFDTIDLGGSQPGCRGEELFDACAQKTCARISRFCQQVTVATMDQATILAQLHTQLGHPDILAGAPDDPIVVRAVATQQACAELIPADGSLPKLDPDQAVGCAYSCPVILNDLHGSLGLALDTLDDQCAAEVHACAGLGKN